MPLWPWVSVGCKAIAARIDLLEKDGMNIRLKAVWLGASLALMGATITPARADEWNKKVELEFGGPVEVPGKVLPAGKYVFQLVDSDSDRNIVQILSVDAEGNQRLVTTVMAIPDYVTETPDKPIVHFEERRGDSPEAIHSWFYPGDNYGWEFVYPKTERLEADSNSTPAVASAPPPVAAPAPTPRAADTDSEPTLIAEEVSVSVTAEEQTVMPTEQSTELTLPETAGYTGIQLLAGIAMLGCSMLTLVVLLCKSQA
jgi:hypothetical protein